MTGEKFQKMYLEMVLNNQARYKQDYHKTVERVADSTAIYKDKPVPFLYNPMFFSKEEEEDFRWIGSMMMEIGDKVTDRYIHDSVFRKKFGFPDFIEEMILRENKYDIHVPIGRFDVFYKDKENFKFCELNTDGSSAMNEDNTIGSILLRSRAMEDFGREHSIRNPELIKSWVEESIKIFKKWDKTEKNPNIAIVDFVESGTSTEFKLFKEAYEAAGYNCIIADPRDLEYRDGSLYHKEYKIDLVYRRIVTFELIEKHEQVSDFISAYMDDAVCVVGTIRSQVVHNKIFFRILHDQDTVEGLNEEQREFIRQHVPFTGLFRGDKKVFDEVFYNKDKYIIKPLDMNASQGVFAGRDFGKEEWEDILEDAFNTDYIYQEFVDPYEREYVVFEDGQFKSRKLGSIIGIFIYNKEYKGLYTRLGAESIISGVTEYYTVPNIIVET
ncbi:glutathionylspermidine synthase family protein [Gudongella sp. DL1XJH-153]|uniref:glutathionylspermidine synthase family protein n=1 Tax=Gudongella sp. DL1XJH-153 TaxID=3409804 RepID=UPI003BB5B9CE